MIIDLHVHTIRGGSDSSLSPEELVAEAKRLGLDGVCLTEHGRCWDRHEWQAFAQKKGLVLLRGMEVETELGHILVFGLDGYVSGIHRATELRRVVETAGGFMIAVHPFRRLFDRPHFGRQDRIPTVAEASASPIFGLVDDIEVVNGGCSDQENFFALQVAKRLEMRGTGGSDAHSKHGLGCFTTVFERDIRSEEEFIQELKAGRFYPAEGFLDGELAPYGDGVVDADLGSAPPW